jgi:hypothetical protein
VTGADRPRPMLWSDFLPPQDAAALGYHTEPLIGAEAVQDGTPPKVTAADPVADLVKAYRLVRDAPYRVERPPPHWCRFAVDETVGAERSTEFMEATVLRLANEAWGQVKAAVVLAQRAGCALCVHDGPTVTVGDPCNLAADTVRVHIRAHMLWPGEQCAHVPRTQYGETT